MVSVFFDKSNYSQGRDLRAVPRRSCSGCCVAVFTHVRVSEVEPCKQHQMTRFDSAQRDAVLVIQQSAMQDLRLYNYRSNISFFVPTKLTVDPDDAMVVPSVIRR